jgi:DeoR/GlpR family transcriptional regulator of sugar metabolism
LIELASVSVVLADHTKFDAKSAVMLAGPGDVDWIVTDVGVEKGMLKGFERLGVKCVRVGG